MYIGKIISMHKLIFGDIGMHLVTVDLYNIDKNLSSKDLFI